MKKQIFALTLLTLTTTSMASTNITYATSPIASKKVVRGNIVFPGHGKVSADLVCYDQATDNFKATIKASKMEVCSNSSVPNWMCSSTGGKLIKVDVPAKNLKAPREIMVKECVDFDRSDSTRPVCIKYNETLKQQPLDYTFGKYELEITFSNYSDAKEYVVKDMADCK